MNEPPQPESRLARRLGTFDAVVIGLGAMIGAGVFAAIGPAAAAAGGGLLIGLGIAAVVAYCNATSSARLAALYPHSGGTYVYGRERLGPAWGFLAGWAFVIGKTASCAAIALTFGAYIDPDFARPLAVGAVVALTAVNLLGVQRATTLVKVMVAIVLGSLAVVVMSSATSSPSVSNIGPLDAGGIRGTLEAAALLFFAFAGYARIATLGDEVRDPVRAIPRAIPIALGITLLVYAAVAFAALVAVGPEALAVSDAPLSTVAEAGTLRLGRARGAHRRDGRLARRSDVAAPRRQPHAVRDGRRGRSSALARCGPCHPPRAPSRRRRRGRRGDRCRPRRRSAGRHRLQLVHRPHVLRDRERVGVDAHRRRTAASISRDCRARARRLRRSCLRAPRVERDRGSCVTGGWDPRLGARARATSQRPGR